MEQKSPNLDDFYKVEWLDNACDVVSSSDSDFDACTKRFNNFPSKNNFVDVNEYF